MQAGVEYFGNGSYEADGEIIALAAHVLKELNVGNFTIELGHAGFFKQLISEIRIRKEDFAELRRFIQGKNIPELERLLERLALPEQTEEVEANPYTHIIIGYEGDGFGDEYIEYEGKVTFNESDEMKKELWNDDMKLYFDGPDDPNYTILEIHPIRIQLMNKKGKPPMELEL